MTLSTNLKIAAPFVVVALAVSLAFAPPASAAGNKCLSAKNTCASKKAQALLKCYAKAEASGQPVDPNCLAKGQAKFDGGLDPLKGCFAKLEAKNDGPCPTTNDTSAIENKVDAFVLDVITEIHPKICAGGTNAGVTCTNNSECTSNVCTSNVPPNKCSSGKKKCVIKKLGSILKCYAKTAKDGTPVDRICIDKARAKFDGDLLLFPDSSKGCFEKLEAKDLNGPGPVVDPSDCLTFDDTAAIEAKVDSFIQDVLCELGDGQVGCGIAAGDDAWLTPVGSSDDLSGNPIPGNFFDPNSDPFAGTLNLQGEPLATNGAGDPLGSTDTLVRRLAGTGLPLLGQQTTVPIEIVALSLVSVNPITVTYNGGMNPELWDVSVALSSAAPQQQGTMTLKRQASDGGSYDSTLPVLPKFRFVRQSDSAVRTLDCGLGGCGPLAVLQGTNAPWAVAGGVGGYDPQATSHNDPVPAGVGVDGDGNGSFEVTTIGSSTLRAGVNPVNKNCALTKDDMIMISHGVKISCEDHYTLYHATGPDGPTVNLQDQFGPQNVNLGLVEFLLNPTRKNIKGVVRVKIAHPDAHLVGYTIPVGTFHATVTIDNQFGPQTIVVDNPRFLAVPSEKAIGPLPITPARLDINHFKCYDAAGPMVNVPAVLIDQFTKRKLTVLDPVFFCNPVKKSSEKILDRKKHLTCYRINPLPFNQPVNVRNQFGVSPVNVLDEFAVCVPTTKLTVTP